MVELRKLSVPSIAVAMVLSASHPGLAGDWFVERSEQAGLDFVHFNGMSGRLYYVEVVGAGGALLDYDNDGDLDVFLVQGAMLGGDRTLADATFPWRGEGRPRDRLYRNDLKMGAEGPELRFTDVTEESGIRSFGYGMGAAAGDIDNDGRVDLYVLNFGQNELWRNLGDGTFEEVAEKLGVGDRRWSTSASFSDYDADGWLDLYVVNYLDYSFLVHKTCLTERGEADYCLPTAYRPAADGLYRSRSGGGFEDVSARAGLVRTASNGLGVVAADFDDDGRIDFYVANDLMANQLWRNQGGGAFSEDGLPLGVALNGEGKAEASMGVDAGDYDGDGDLDLFMTHFRRESNTLFRDSGGFFEDATDDAKLTGPSWLATSFGTAFLDYDSDGWLDLLVVSGAVTYPPGSDRLSSPFPFGENNQLFRNLGGKRFEDTTAAAGAAFELSNVSRGALVGDLDNDGDVDVIVTNNNGPARLLLNQYQPDHERGSPAGWIGIELLTGPAGKPGRPALGAMVTASISGRNDLVRRVHNDGSYASSSDPRVIIGLGAAAPAKVDRLLVRWPDGSTSEEKALATGRYHTLRQLASESLSNRARKDEP